MAKATKTAPAYLKSAQRETVSETRLEELRKLIREDRTLQHRIANGEALLKTLKAERHEYEHERIPTLMEALRISSFTLEAEGNNPAVEIENAPYYKAGISKEAENAEERREAMHDYLEEIGHGDLIEYTVTYQFEHDVDPRLIQEFIRRVGGLQVFVADRSNRRKRLILDVPIPTRERGVHWRRLTSWLKRQVEEEKFIPDLEKLGAFVGRKAEPKEVKTKS